MNHPSSTAFHAAVTAPASVRPGELSGLLERVVGLRELSLDCFDTVIWRLTEHPADVFHDAAQRPAFIAHGLSARERVMAERQARDLKRVRHGRTEVSLADIYREARPDLDELQVEALAEDELAAEMQACYAFPAAVALLRNARAKRLEVTIVSDTYFDENRLRRLLAHVLPADAMSAIGRIVCSSEHGVSKVQGLHERAHRGPSARRRTILHVGDNRAADYEAARRHGLQAVHLVQHDRTALARSRMQAVAMSMLDPGVRSTRSLQIAYRGVFAAGNRCADAPGRAIGYASLGPIMHAFGSWIVAQRDSLHAAGKRVKLLFLMRDGHLPALAFEQLEPDPDLYRVRISRFTARAASFRSLLDIDRYLAEFAASKRFDALARQLLLPEELARELITEASAAADPLAAFCRAVRRPGIVARVIEASSRFRERMRRYLERETGMQSGDTLVFVDLGYVGTSQRLLQPVFEQEWGVELLGRYLLAVGPVGEKRRGLIDRSGCEDRAIATVVPYVSLLENLCANDAGSARDYTDDGQVVLSERLIGESQSQRAAQVQAQCLDFVRDAQAFFADCLRPPSPESLRDAAFAELARLMFLPGEGELDFLEGFQLDMNLGTSDRLQLFDREAGLSGLRRRGLNFMERNDEMRLLYPAELRTGGLELSMTLMAQHRFSLDIPISEWSHRREAFEMIVMKGERSSLESIEGQATHDGYFAAVFPIGKGELDLGLLLGKTYAWIQVFGVELVALDSLMSDRESRHSMEIRDALILDGIRDHGQGLWECSSPASLAMLPAGTWPRGNAAACRFVFRPIVRREVRSDR